MYLSNIHIGHSTKVLARITLKQSVIFGREVVVSLRSPDESVASQTSADRHNRGTTGDTQYVASVLLCGVFVVHEYAYRFLEILASRTTITLVVLAADRSSE
ncbi:hypothetical protein V1478_017327 [Vespula squamosa]|uniref:Uncharacterized protein n=1 Tax=Vespula squamosa TaxID=30214 RepID=A0ABD1ZXN3_VESSQ